MKNYDHILLAADFFNENQVVINKAKSLADKYQARLSIVHVVDSIPITDAGYGGDIPFDLDLTAELMAIAKKKLLALAEELTINSSDTWLEIGSPKTEIVRIANETQVDLIVLGSHGRHGIALLLGSTANGVLHHAQCDVLAVRLQDN
ncbi:MAG: universal stress protein [Methylovulum sp.]|nr:universal stress protein [Methylovulum sp.]